MSENQSSQPVPDPANIPAQDSTMDDVNKPLADSTEQMTIESIQPDVPPSATADLSASSTGEQLATAEKDWETAALPGTVDAAPASTSDASTFNSARENELLTLIHDLNDCNDVLLSRVSQLETTLRESQSESRRVLQQATDHANAEKNKVAERLVAEQLTAEQTAQTAQQQIASLVAQLEAAEQSLQRQQLMNETNQAELRNAQERVGQLEHECAMGAQRHAEEAQARVTAETTIRDLRSRLQLQQRYTLQFKAALEKSLTVTARAANAPKSNSTDYRTVHASTRPTSFSEAASTSSFASNGVTMPKARRIMPWAGELSSPFEGIDPHLESLIRGANTPKPPSRSSETSLSSSGRFADKQPNNEPLARTKLEEPDTKTVLSTDSDAEDNLWKDMERVIAVSADVSTGSDVSKTIDATVGKEAPTEETASEKNVTSQVLFSAESAANVLSETPEKEAEQENAEPKLNWQRQEVEPTEAIPSDAQLIAQAVNRSPDELSNEPSSKVLGESETIELTDSSSEGVKEEPLIQALEQKAPNDRAVVIDPYTVPTGQTPAAEVAFSEPSPWGQPLVEKAMAKAAEKSAKLSDIADSEEYLPAMDTEASAVAPTVNPLRSQRKIGSMSAVQLPTFEKAKAGSFKR